MLSNYSNEQYPVKNKGVTYLAFDTSGSIDDNKKSYYRGIYDYYKNTSDKVFVYQHTVVASVSSIEVVEDTPIQGGTYVSSALQLIAGNIVASGYTTTNIQIVICGDGDNWSEDNKKAFNCIKSFVLSSINVIFHNVLPNDNSKPLSTSFIQLLKDSRIKEYNIKSNEDDIFGNPQSVIGVFYEVEHSVNGFRFKFRSKDKTLKVGDIVICNTIKGKCYGKLVNIKTEKVATKEEYLKYKECTGLNGVL